ncbi:hypothetical protein OESDEN_07032 [Oesophagostomum dentatum]|uniref:glucuronosyltransferase n=1 Tax=Oesophagostomum dentatum TaxID=61180 RepID=A0A0B1T676_OESDE|nr:hypothetical protein OESDEN_07032 [Oesophagostomum dentatum]
MIMLQLLVLFLTTIACNSYKILVVNPKFGYSHMNFMGKIADTLADAGHDVVTLQPVFFPFTNNGTTKSRLIQVHVDLPAEFLAGDMQKQQQRIWTSPATNPLNLIRFSKLFRNFVTSMTSKTLEEKGLMEHLKEENFDVGITELFEFAGVVFFEAIGLKNVIGVHSSTSVFEKTAYSIGMPVIPSFMPGRSKSQN